MPDIYLGDERIAVTYHAVDRARERLWPDRSDDVILYLIERMLNVGTATDAPPPWVSRNPEAAFVECGEAVLVLVGNPTELVITTVLTYGRADEHPGANRTRGARLLSRLTAQVAA